MKIFLLINDEKRRKAKLPHPEADHAVVEGACPKCKAETFGVQGSGRHASKDDRAWEAEGYCTACDQHAYAIRAEIGTLFAAREDEATPRYGCKIY